MDPNLLYGLIGAITGALLVFMAVVVSGAKVVKRLQLGDELPDDALYDLPAPPLVERGDPSQAQQTAQSRQPRAAALQRVKTIHEQWFECRWGVHQLAEHQDAAQRAHAGELLDPIAAQEPAFGELRQAIVDGTGALPSSLEETIAALQQEVQQWHNDLSERLGQPGTNWVLYGLVGLLVICWIILVLTWVPR